jgi:ethanolamine ammonia-lyase small subunit
VTKPDLTKSDVKAALEPEPSAIPDLRQMTEARVQLGRFGAGVPTRAAQSFLLDHARARQAVWSEVAWKLLASHLSDLGRDIAEIQSEAGDRSVYVRRPDLGRRLSRASAERLSGMPSGADIVLVVADGLSASAIEAHATPLVRAIVARLSARRLSIAPLVLASQARVALGDPIGDALKARVSIVLIGERPGLSSADSLGVYMTFDPKPGTPDSRRNCISNIRNGGLGIERAADMVLALVTAMLATGVSGIDLKPGAARLPGE